MGSQTFSRISIRDQMIADAAQGAPFFMVLQSLSVRAIELQIDPDLSTPHLLDEAWPAGERLDGESSIARFAAMLSDNGIAVSAILLMTDFSAANAGDHVTWAIRAAEIARQLHVPAVRVDPLTRDRDMDREIVQRNFIQHIKQVLTQTPAGVELGIENHGPVGNDPAFLDAVFSAVNDDRLGMTLDTGNFYWWGVPLQELYRLLERYGPRAKHTHVKNINYPAELVNVARPVGLDYGKHRCPLDEGNIDLRRAVQILNRAGYRRDFCIENESLNKFPAAQRVQVLARDVAALHSAIGS